MRIALVVAAAENNTIGKNNQLLWRLPNDMKFFKNTTWGMPVIMGRKTFESLGKPLAGRTNIVITRQENWTAPGVKVVKTLKEAIAAAADTDAKEAFVIGGGEVYALAMPMAQLIYLTRVHATFEGDTWFPTFDEQQWELLSNLDFPADEKHAYGYSFQVWRRR
ncbi:dihydrofolate reductase [Paraflavitalea speifideaquila]|uniref:dihydrofolate reductase n=1 Tax=Paraflavitalea speifideaquila TaxID=3076558 RepID=UPI0028E93A05|nr:dihydrofolate reductase [Paraflavitalea speifideiaquila]